MFPCSSFTVVFIILRLRLKLLVWHGLHDLTHPHFPTPSLYRHFILRDTSYLIFQQLLGSTRFCNFHPIFIFLVAFYDGLSGIPFLLSLFDWMSLSLEAISDNLPPRWLVLQPWILLYPSPWLPALNYNYLLSEYLLCSISVLGFLRVRNVTSIFVFSHTTTYH